MGNEDDYEAEWAAEKAKRVATATQWVADNCDAENTHIRVWSFYDAPEELQKLSTYGGDEDWLALVPPHLADDYIGWLESGSSFGCCDVDETPLDGGWTVRIGAHS